MAIAANDIERIVRKVLSEEQDETADAVRELSTLLTEQVIPKLSKSDGDEVDGDDEVDPDEAVDADDDEDDLVTMSAFDDDEAPRFARTVKPNGGGAHDEDDPPEQEVPTAAIDAFTTLYNSLSSEQASALAELFTVIDSELDKEGEADEETDEEEMRAQG